jgi:hypothetical protein
VDVSRSKPALKLEILSRNTDRGVYGLPVSNLREK